MKKKKTDSTSVSESPGFAPGFGDRLVSGAVFVVIGVVYIATLFILYPGLPIIEQSPEAIPGFVDNYPPFRVDEDAYYHISRRILDGTIYTGEGQEIGFTAGFPLVAAPFVAVFDKMGGYITNLLIVFLSLIVFNLTLRRYGFRRRAAVLTFIAAFASLEWFYAVSNYSEPFAQLLVMLAFFFLAPGRFGRSETVTLLAAGFCTGLILFVRPHCFLIAIPFFLYLLFTNLKPSINRRALLYACGTAAAMLLWTIRNQFAFGSPFAFEYTRLVGSFAPGMQSSYMKGNIFLGIHGLLFDEYHGLLTITPVFLLFPAGLHAMWNRGLKRESLALLCAVVLVTLFVASGPYPFTEFGLGSRHMVPVTLLLLFPVVFFIDGKAFSSAVTILVVVYSFYQAGIGWFTGGEPGMGFFTGILNDAQSRAAILASKGLLPQKTFRTQEELIHSYEHALRRANMKELLQTMDPMVIQNIRGHERDFMLFLRRQPDPKIAIQSVDPSRGIIIRNFSITGGFVDSPAPPDTTRTP